MSMISSALSMLPKRAGLTSCRMFTLPLKPEQKNFPGIASRFLHHTALSSEQFQRTRMTCYRCGEPGHRADSCTKERTCYNCGQPGHVTADCDAPRKVSVKRCFSCGEEGHVKSECPQLKCFRCGGSGHMSRNCTNAPVESERTKNIKCYKCQQTGHISRDCPETQQAEY
ncbi:uncharacterized protein ARMOST_05422 [Armillaria ostoyae]|uniref:CCHC-type domain-containing protein n=1 Tax=Armillaria ostoyae TaxID=47428 RepID=A0A284R034_ARMOS|nr:uncharacterized protein ARMOST_05422 [Armillaria ostoyae]